MYKGYFVIWSKQETDIKEVSACFQRHTPLFLFFINIFSTSCQNSKILPRARDQIYLLTQIKKII